MPLFVFRILVSCGVFIGAAFGSARAEVASAAPDSEGVTHLSLAIVRVAEGELSGVRGTDASITVFKGIPFAAPPVGALRWQPPQPAKPWSGVRKADTFGASAMQPDQRLLLPWTEEYMFRNQTSEDCLTLNIWTPAKSSSERRAVFVYIHGGAYSSGSGEVLLYDGEGLAKKGIIVVTINYRLGVFGFLAHPELTAESPHHASGNYGLMDQMAALRWLQKNIAAFGGDPARVTVAGQSAGAGSIHHLMVSPEARGLFARAIAQSGPPRHDDHTPTLLEAEEQGRIFGEAIAAPTLAEMRGLSATELFTRYQAHNFRFRPVVDGWVVPDQLPAVYKQGKQIDVPLLTGWVADERSFSPGRGLKNAAEFAAQAATEFGVRAPEFLSLYPVASDDDAGAAQKQRWRDAARADLFWWTSIRAKKGHAKDWGYFFDRAIPWPEHPEYQAFHSGELPYVFNNLGLMNRPWTDVDRRLADQTSGYWVNFVERGDPNGAGLPEWPDDNGKLLRLGASVGAQAVLSAEKLKFFLAPAQ